MKSRNHVAKAACTALFVAMLALTWTSMSMAQATPGEAASGSGGTNAGPSTGGGMMNGMGEMMGGSSGSPATGMNNMNQGAAPSPGENDTSHTRMMGKSSSRKGCCMKHMRDMKHMHGMMSGGSGGMGNMGGMMGGSAAPSSAPNGSESH
ncbi:MAG TPA: hypothetical protein VKT99_04755 [Xanthobacteraceae bacterium]|nr:hypothetical protein [Xanthobacteraceae bacterium]